MHGQGVMLRPWLILLLATILAFIAAMARVASWLFAGLAVLLVALGVLVYFWRRGRRRSQP